MTFQHNRKIHKQNNANKVCFKSISQKQSRNNLSHKKAKQETPLSLQLASCQIFIVLSKTMQPPPPSKKHTKLQTPKPCVYTTQENKIFAIFVSKISQSKKMHWKRIIRKLMTFKSCTSKMNTVWAGLDIMSMVTYIIKPDNYMIYSSDTGFHKNETWCSYVFANKPRLRRFLTRCTLSCDMTVSLSLTHTSARARTHTHTHTHAAIKIADVLRCDPVSLSLSHTRAQQSIANT